MTTQDSSQNRSLSSPESRDEPLGRYSQEQEEHRPYAGLWRDGEEFLFY